MMNKWNKKLVSTPESMVVCCVLLSTLNKLALIFTRGDIVFLDSTTTNIVEPKSVSVQDPNLEPTAALPFGGDQLFIACKSGHVVTLTFNTQAPN